MADKADILIYYMKDNSRARETALAVADFLRERGRAPILARAGEELPEETWGCEAAVALGGDGTILGLARGLAGTGIAIFGINFGHVGFLTAAAPHDWREKLAEAAEGRLPVSRCAALKWSLARGGETLASGVCANDATLNRSRAARLISTDVYIDGIRLGTLRSDGLIVSAPLGSTGYCVSAGGAIVYRELNAISLVPVCPFPLGVAPLVAPASAEIELRVNESAADCHCTFDGAEAFALEAGDVLRATGWERAIALYGEKEEYFRHLKERGFNLEN